MLNDATKTQMSATCTHCGVELPPGATHCTPCLIELGLQAGNQNADAVAEQRAFHFGDYEISADAPRLEGGMGIVYRARQASLNRIVALKMIKGGVLAGPGRGSRFRREAEAVARLDHPHIVPIYDIGEHDGRSFFTMKWMEGGSLADVLRRRRNVSGGNAQGTVGEGHIAGSGYTPRRAAEIIVIVARAIHHAHQRGIIHRDLTPSNILLGAEGQPYVSDFGVAKRLDNEAPALTQSGAAVGTPGYMAPEQASGNTRDLTIGADIFSLGALFYELLTGRPPFAGETPAATLQNVLMEEPKRPAAIASQVPKDLETICLKCLEKDPERRFGSAEALADDLDRWLRGEPILARPSGIWSRARKWAKRRPAVAALGAALVLVSAAGLIDFGRAQRAAQIAAQDRETLRQASISVGRLLKVADDDDFKEPAFDTMRKEFLESIVPFLEASVQRNDQDPTVQAEKAAIHRDLAGLLQQLGDFPQAETNFLRGIELQTRLVKDWPTELGYQRDLALTYSTFGWLMSQEQRQPNALAAERTAFGMIEKVCAALPNDRSIQTDQARICQLLGSVLTRNGDGKEAEETFRAAIRVATPLAEGPMATPEARYELGSSWLNLGNLISNQDRPKDTEACWDESLRIFESLAVDQPGHVENRHKVAIARGRFSRLYADHGRWSEADASFKEFRDQMQRLARDYPLRASFQDELADECRYFGIRCLRAGRTNQVSELFETAVEVEERVVKACPQAGKFRANLIAYYAEFGDLLKQVGRFAEAEEADSNSVALAVKLVAEFPGLPDYRAQLADASSQFGELLEKQGDKEAASAMLQKSLGAWEKLVRDFPTNLDYRTRMGEVKVRGESLAR
jgi:tetratricopeptide (TPR) repeat protein